jgi:septal ring factor EnvC (AmiA/AmiB activator)
VTVADQRDIEKLRAVWLEYGRLEIKIDEADDEISALEDQKRDDEERRDEIEAQWPELGGTDDEWGTGLIDGVQLESPEKERERKRAEWRARVEAALKASAAPPAQVKP